MKRKLTLILAACSLLVAGALYGQSRERSRSYGSDRSYDRGSSRSSNGFSNSASSSSSNSPATTSTASTNPSSRPAPVAHEPPSVGRTLPGEYALLSRKSIFARDRRPYTERPRDYREPPRIAESAPAPRPPAIPVLVGVLIGDDDLIAYIEDPDSGKLWPLAAGDPLPGSYGTVQRVTLDDITIATDNGPEHHILIGQNLAGDAATSRTLSPSPSSPAAATEPGAATAPAGTPGSLDPNEPGISIEEKMKRRRMQQVGK